MNDDPARPTLIIWKFASGFVSLPAWSFFFFFLLERAAIGDVKSDPKFGARIQQRKSSDRAVRQVRSSTKFHDNRV